MLCSLATNVGTKEIEAMGTLEKELGTHLLAYSCHDYAPAEISGDQIEKIKKLESEIGMVLVAVKK